MKAVIMAGGKGTRISKLAETIPKPMMKICNKPVLEYEIECLRRQGITDIILTVGHLSHVIVDYFGNGNKISPVTGEKFGVNIEYYFEEKPLGNAGALFKIKEKLQEDFLLLNGDLIFDIDLERFINFHYKKGGLVTLFTHPNDHPYDSGLILADENGVVQKWLAKEDERPMFYKNCVNGGVHIINPKVLEHKALDEKVDLDRQILKPLAGTGKMFAYHSPEYVKDMGTPERFFSISQDVTSRKMSQKNLKNRQRAIFLDRDGTINKYVGFLTNIDDFKLIDGVAEAIKLINSLGYLGIVVTNQPVIARGEVSIQQLNEIHNKMETLLGEEGAYLDAIYYCPHHPDKGYSGEVPQYKVACECRKPKSGMLLAAAQEYNIDLSNSWIIGDSKNDILAGINAGCHTAYIGEEQVGQSLTVDSLLAFAQYLYGNDYEKGEKQNVR